MAWSDYKILDADFTGHDIAGLDDDPNLTPALLKARFDSLVKDVVQEKFNFLIDVIAGAIINNLTAGGLDKMLSAEMGKMLDQAKINYTDIINNLTAGGVNKPLSAEMGKMLDQAKINYTDIINNLTAGGVNKPLSSEMGKMLDQMKVNANSTINVYMRAHNDATITLAAGSSLALSFPTFDAQSAITYDGTAKEFTVVNAGTYLISVMVQCASAADLILIVSHSNTGNQYYNKNTSSSLNAVSPQLYLPAGNKFQVYGNSSVSNTIAAGKAILVVSKIN